MVAFLPYMRQLPLDYYIKNYPVAPSVTVPGITVSVPVFDIVEEEEEGAFSGGAFTGNIPPVNPLIGWMWLNPENNGLYVYTDPGVWTQVGTNW